MECRERCTEKGWICGKSSDKYLRPKLRPHLHAFRFLMGETRRNTKECMPIILTSINKGLTLMKYVSVYVACVSALSSLLG